MDKKQSSTNYEKHIIICPSCGKDVLDHMVKCPYCEADLPKAYKEMPPKTKKIIRISLWVLMGLLAITLIVLKALEVI